jgi:hypothetical protein
MIKKLITFFAVLGFASSASFALACDTSCSGKKGDKDAGTGLSNISQFEVAGGGCGSKCGDKKDDK